MRIAIVYDCLFPHTVGGAERWYRNLAERLSERHAVTYLTRRQWERGEGPGTPFETLAVAPGGRLYTSSGRRRIWPPLRFGIGVFWHLLRHASRYDVVHSASFPYFSLIGAWLALRLRRRGHLVVDWHEVWSRRYWISYLGAVRGRIGHGVQRICARLPDQSFTFSRLYESRLAGEGHRAPTVRLSGEYAPDDGAAFSPSEPDRAPLVLFVGRHIPEKGVALVPEVIAAARRTVPELRCTIAGDGPERERVASRVRELGLGDVIELPGRVAPARVRELVGRATCLLLPSQREGYGLVVVEAAARGTPSVVVSGPDNAATELVEDGVNGLVIPDPDEQMIADGIARIVSAGPAMRRSTFDWYREHARALSIASSMEAVEDAYRDLGG